MSKLGKVLSLSPGVIRAYEKFEKHNKKIVAKGNSDIIDNIEHLYRLKEKISINVCT